MTASKIVFALIFLITSCGYRMTNFTDTDGKTYRIRQYKKYEDHEKYIEQNVFAKQNQPKTYSRYSGSISVITVDSVPYVQFDTVRVGFKKDARKFIDIFSSGLLSSEIIYCTLDSLCRVPSPLLVAEFSRGKVAKPHIAGWYGDIITVGSIEEPDHLKISPQKRRFKLYVNAVYGGSGYNVYFIELSNAKTNTYVDMKEFVKNASLTFITTPWNIP
jgi:hypothetical protein